MSILVLLAIRRSRYTLTSMVAESKDGRTVHMDVPTAIFSRERYIHEPDEF